MLVVLRAGLLTCLSDWSMFPLTELSYVKYVVKLLHKAVTLSQPENGVILNISSDTR
jgi:hypothetical protein